LKLLKMNTDDGRSAVAEFMAAVTALEIAEQFFVCDIAQFGTRGSPGGTTQQATEDRSRKTSKQHAGRTADGADSCSALGTGQGACCTRCGAADCAECAADSSGCVQAINVGRMADGTFVTHGFFS